MKPELRPVLLALAGTVAVWLVDPWSVPAIVLGIILGVFVGASLPPEWTDEPRLGPVASLRHRQPWTEPGWTRDRAYLRGVA